MGLKIEIFQLFQKIFQSSQTKKFFNSSKTRKEKRKKAFIYQKRVGKAATSRQGNLQLAANGICSESFKGYTGDSS